MKTYKFYTDPGHGWIAVKIKELMQLGITTQISPYSYVRGHTVYLEEDCDAALFVVAYVDKYGVRPNYVYANTNKNSSIRSYERYNRNKVVDFALSNMKG